MYLATNASIEEFLDQWFTEHEYLHNFILNRPLVVGADWERSSFDQFTREDTDGEAVYQWALTTEGVESNNLGHHLLRIEGFTAYGFDIGPITDANIELVEPAGPNPFAVFHT